MCSLARMRRETILELRGSSSDLAGMVPLKAATDAEERGKVEMLEVVGLDIGVDRYEG